MIDTTLRLVEWVLGMVLAGGFFHLLSLVLARSRRNDARSYFAELRLRGVELLFYEDPVDIMSGLQLLARFGLPAPLPASIMSRIIALTAHADRAVADLALQTLRRLTRAGHQGPAARPEAKPKFHGRSTAAV